MPPESAWTVSVRELPARHNGVREVPQLPALPQHVFTSRKRGLAVLFACGVVSWGMFRGCVAAPKSRAHAHRIAVVWCEWQGRAGNACTRTVVVHASGQSCMSRGAPLARPTESLSGRARVERYSVSCA